jgi:hypothetical protein
LLAVEKRDAAKRLGEAGKNPGTLPPLVDFPEAGKNRKWVVLGVGIYARLLDDFFAVIFSRSMKRFKKK